MRKTSKTGLSFLLFGYAFLYIPIAFLIIFSFSDSQFSGIWTKFSFKWYKTLLADDELIMSTITSLEIASIAATCSVILGVLAALITTKKGTSPGKNFLNSSITVPIVMPDIIIGFSLLMLFIWLEKTFGIPKERGMMTVTIGHIMASVAYVHMTIRSCLLSFDKSLEEAAMDLGAKPFTVFTRITIPLISKALFAGWLLAFTLSLDDIVIASFLSGPGSTTLPILIFSSIRIGVSPVTNALATIFVAIVGICLLTASILTNKNAKK